QYPVEIPGVNNTYFLRAALNAQRKSRGEPELDSMQFLKKVREKLAVLHLKDELLHRGVNEGFSGGEKKRNEIFQLALLEPKLAILDETDSGLDIDALKAVADGVNLMRSPERAFLVITHYQRLLDYIKPDVVHVLADGRIVESAGPELALKPGSAALPPERVRPLGRGPARRAALADAPADGLPGARVEPWKSTSLRALANRRFLPAASGNAGVDPALVAGIPAPRLVFVNGAFDAALSDLSGLPRDIALLPFSQVLAEGHPRDAAVLGRRFERADEAFARFNAALALDGVRLVVPAGLTLDAPVHLAFLGVPAEGDLAWHLRHLIELGKGARATVVEHHLAAGAHRHLGNHLVHVHLAAGASLRHARLQQEDAGATLLARTDAMLGSDSEYRRVDLELGGGLARHELNVQLVGERAAVHAGGVLVADGRRHLDTRLDIEHRARDSRCELPWRGMADERGRAVFHGGITIQAGADGTEAELSSKNLLLSDQAEVDTQPVLVIHADEVKAAHGATVGRLDETALFYLRSRGLPGTEARRLLVQAFLHEPLAVLDDETAYAALSAAIERRLAREAQA